MGTNWIRCASWCLALLVVAPAAAAAAEKLKGQPVGQDVVVYVKQDGALVPGLARAEQVASRIFAKIGVRVVFRGWGARKPAGDAVAIEIRLDSRTPANHHPGALAYATPYAGTAALIHIFFDRVLAQQADAWSGTLLGHVMAHEIGHILEGVDRHSAEGVMKARFVTEDFHQMTSGNLPFDPTDAELIHTALEGKATLFNGTKMRVE
jgi:hypothetical protein